MANELELLTTWYRKQCNGKWESQHGVKLTSLDEPGWALDVHYESGAAEASFDVAPVNFVRSEFDWITYEMKEGSFRGRCGPGNLTEMISAFLEIVGV